MGLSRNAAYMYPTKKVFVGKTYENQQKSFKINQESFRHQFCLFCFKQSSQTSPNLSDGQVWISMDKSLALGEGSPMFPQLANGCNPSWDIMGIYPMSTWDFKDP